METGRKYVVGIGEALWDVLPEGKKIGGAPANFAYHVSQFGLESRVVSAVGDDALGEEILENFMEKNLKCIVPKVAFPTGTVQVTVDPAGVPAYDIRQGVAWDNIPFTEELERLAGQTRAVCYGSLAQRSEVSRNTIRSFLEAMPDGDDIYRVFDINLRQQFYTEAVSEYCKRLTRFAQVTIRELPEKRTLAEEAELILKELRGYVIVLAVEGHKLSSESLAEKVKTLCDAGKEMTFVIGSSCGLDSKVKKTADYMLSFSDMTFPHQLMRVILCEQVYRAFMINSGSEYHK